MASAVISVALAVASSAVAQDWAKANLAKSSRHGEFVTIHEPSGRDLQAWVVYPEVKDKAPVVVMIHEIFGMSDWAREMADEVAGAGYIVVEPDLLSGLGPARTAGMSRFPVSKQDVSFITTPRQETAPAKTSLPGTGCDPMPCAAGQKPVRESAASQQPSAPMDHHAPPAMQAGGQAYVPAQPGGTSAFPDQSAVTRAVSSLPDAQVLADLDAAADYGNKLPAANGKLFVAGFCWGGGKTFLFATHRHDLSAAFVFYGPPPAEDLMKNITAPVYGFYAQNDARISSTIPKTQDEMKALGKTYEPVVYDGAGHGFMRAGEAPDANAANSAARREGFKRLIDLLGGVR
ncbi:MAG TPA: dienelactone hydrolase family protein [Bryocella sp.]|nr:dienelactone hydrolase family protein [Bryocella sp.]